MPQQACEQCANKRHEIQPTEQQQELRQAFSTNMEPALFFSSTPNFEPNPKWNREKSRFSLGTKVGVSKSTGHCSSAVELVRPIASKAREP